MISARAIAHTIAAFGGTVAALLYQYSPTEYPFYPRCPFYALTHLYCPGCGATRAIADLLHGHLVAAMQFNAAVTLLLPMLLWYFGKMYWTAVRENRMAWPNVPAWSWRAALAGVLLFAVARDFVQTIS